jgi:hypothetical protein
MDVGMHMSPNTSSDAADSKSRDPSQERSSGRGVPACFLRAHVRRIPATTRRTSLMLMRFLARGALRSKASTPPAACQEEPKPLSRPGTDVRISDAHVDTRCIRTFHSDTTSQLHPYIPQRRSMSCLVCLPAIQLPRRLRVSFGVPVRQ